MMSREHLGNPVKADALPEHTQPFPKGYRKRQCLDVGPHDQRCAESSGYMSVCSNVRRAFLLMTDKHNYRSGGGQKAAVKKAPDHSDV